MKKGDLVRIGPRYTGMDEEIIGELAIVTAVTDNERWPVEAKLISSGIEGAFHPRELETDNEGG